MGKSSSGKENIMSGLNPVVVTTEHRGVFGGLLESQDGNEVVLQEARMCVYWSRDVRGVVGLAAKGPDNKSKITPAADRIALNSVTAVMEMTPEALERWREEPWG